MQEIIGFDPGVSIFWIWLNFTGFFFTVIIAYLVSAFGAAPVLKADNLIKVDFSWSVFKTKEAYILIGFFVLILILSWFLPAWLS